MTDKALKELLDNYTVVIYDGICGFCNASIQFILKQRPSQKLRFVSFQSELGQKVRSNLNINENLDSIIVVEKDRYFKKSEAIFRILNQIHSSWRYLKYFRFIPMPISNFVYTIIANNRYRIKKNDSCTLLTQEEAQLFI